MKIIMLGPPGAGKGTQAANISEKTGLPTLSTGHILRTAVREGTPVGLKAKEFMDAGKLVPDEVIIEVVKEFLSREAFSKGYILDGMPRTLKQAQMLDEMNVAIDTVILIELSDEAIMRRMTGRRVCSECSAVFNLNSKPPRIEGICDLCGKELEQRRDDMPETIEERLRVYHAETEPIIEFYRSKGKIRAFDGSLDIVTTTELIMESMVSFK